MNNTTIFFSNDSFDFTSVVKIVSTNVCGYYSVEYNIESRSDIVAHQISCDIKPAIEACIRSTNKQSVLAGRTIGFIIVEDEVNTTEDHLDVLKQYCPNGFLMKSF